MVNGLPLFRKYFSAYSDRYILIGGCACDIHFNEVALPFRATKDFDIVLIVEALDAAFVRAFWVFVRMGGYEIRQKSNGERQFYRFMRPRESGYPAMLELFSRKPEQLMLTEASALTPLPAEKEVSSLSAILLHEDYYRLLMDNRLLRGGISLASPEALVVLKAKAWMDLRARRAAGEGVDSKDIRKHRNDIARLAAIITPEPMRMASPVAEDMAAFIEEYERDLPDTTTLGLPMSAGELLSALKLLFGVGKG